MIFLQFKCYLLRNVYHINDCIYDFGFGLHFRLILVQRKFASIYDDSLSFDCLCAFLFSLLFLHHFVLYKRSKGLECVLGRWVTTVYCIQFMRALFNSAPMK